ncbi:MAG: SLC13/DASS family transporter [Bacteroidetes bacterium]|nr:SLC13/DASS family transporter [Bacteroidota bacterium]MBK7109906.1 SLC13/DASS family transporter [Bacteroidota bacterium]MBK8487367.1 SLC13/DASS family transporter [Bacteroidota bacterium]
MHKKQFVFFGGPFLALLVGFAFYFSGYPFILCCTAAVLILMAYWWMTEAVNLFITSFLPLMLFPVFGIMKMQDVAPLYMRDVMFLYIGGFLLTFAIERWNLHKRISLNILLKFGGSPEKLLLGFILASYFLSMWLNNTSTTLMLLPICLAVINQLHNNNEKKLTGISAALLIGVAFASSIGGTATLIGTLPNMVMKDFYDAQFSNTAKLDFGRWFLFAFPMSFVFVMICYWVLRIMLVKKGETESVPLDYIVNEKRTLGKMQYEEKAIAIIFSIAVVLWFTIDAKDFGAFVIPGWSNLLPDPDFVSESYVAMFMMGLLFFTPSKNKKGENLVTWEEFKKIPLGIIFLFGGGFALAEGVKVSGLGDWIAQNLVALQYLPLWLMIFCLCLITTLFSEFASNTATAILFMTILVPVIGQMQDVPPLMIMMPVAMAASYSFMLPVGTPPNTIVFGTEKVSVRQMMRTGIWLDIIGAIVITLFMMTLGRFVFGI